LARGAVVVTDRYVDSSIAYQGTGRHLGVNEVTQLSRWATQGLAPDLTVLLDIAAEAGRGRRGHQSDRLEAEPDEFHTRVRDRFLHLARRAPSRYLVVDAALDAALVHDAVRERLQPMLPESPVARAERLGREEQERAETDRVAAAAAAERAEAERVVAAEAAAREQAESDERAAREQAQREQAERAAREVAERERAERERVERERAATAPVQVAEPRPVDPTMTLPVVPTPASGLDDEIFGDGPGRGGRR
ncbi:MAG: dTMP kinase, partial [Actinomycetota bacterium]